jgi:hypothetical protein
MPACPVKLAGSESELFRYPTAPFINACRSGAGVPPASFRFRVEQASRLCLLVARKPPICFTSQSILLTIQLSEFDVQRELREYYIASSTFDDQPFSLAKHN